MITTSNFGRELVRSIAKSGPRGPENQARPPQKEKELRERQRRENPWWHFFAFWTT